MSSRFGGQKVLVDWKGQPLLRHIASNAIAADLSPVIVVVGALVEPVKKALAGLPITHVINHAYEKGMGTSLREGIKAVQESVTGALLFLGDQPCSDPILVKALIENHNKADVVVPVHNGKAGHPVLWNKHTFSRITNMQDAETGKSIQQEFSRFFLDWSDPMILRDIDTQEDYHQLLHDNGSRQF